MRIEMWFGALLITALFNGTACLGTGDAARDDATQSDDIIGGKTASQYPEAALVDIFDSGELIAACSGSVIAPKVVLTAGHCVHKFNEWRVTAPFADGQTATVARGVTYDWKVASESVDPSKHDIGLLILGNEINLSDYPRIATAPIAAGAKVRNIGRIQNGNLSDSALFVSKAITTEPGDEMGFPFDYGAMDEIESGDSGGPDVLPGAAPHTIVAVNSGANAETEVLARVDLVAAWIEKEVKAAK
jgi:hypothetical protein